LTDSEQGHQGDIHATTTVGLIHDDNAIDDKTRNILSQLSKKGTRSIEPVFGLDSGFRYPELGGIALHEQLDYLHQLEKAGFVTSELHETILRCPECESTRFSTQLSCTVCKSSNVTRGAVIEHLTCGNIDFDTKYGSQGTNTFVCPKCGKRLKAIGVDYARPGIFYSCLHCKALLPQAENAHICLNCTKKWSEAELKELQLMKYTIDLEKTSKYLVRDQLFALVAEMLYFKHGIKAESPGKLKGLSKVEHTFDLLVTHYEKGEPMLVADLMLEDKNNTRITSVKILAFYAKCLDSNYSTTNVIRKILVTQSELAVEAKELALAYGITIFQTTDPEELTSQILKVLSSERLQE
jgi:hypothetical protein